MADDGKSTVKSIGKAFAVLHAFDPARSAMTITEVATHCGLDRGTAFRLIHTLIDLGYLAAVPGTRRFRLTLRCLDLGFNALAAGGLKAQCAPLLRDLVPGVAEAASFGVRDGADVVYVERVQVNLGRRDLDRRVGSRTGAYATALGHAILAWEDPAQARGVLSASERIRLSDRTLIDLDALCHRLAEVRARGYAISDGENAYGLRTVAAPVLGLAGVPHGAVSLTARQDNHALDVFVDRTLPPLLAVSQALSRAVCLTGGGA